MNVLHVQDLTNDPFVMSSHRCHRCSEYSGFHRFTDVIVGTDSVNCMHVTDDPNDLDGMVVIKVVDVADATDISDDIDVAVVIDNTEPIVVMNVMDIPDFHGWMLQIG